jgi:hypothetical protein
MERYLLRAYVEVRNNEGRVKSRLRAGLEQIMNSSQFLGITDRYGLRFPEPVGQRYADLASLTKLTADHIRNFYEAQEHHPEFYSLAMKLLIQLNKMEKKTDYNAQLSRLRDQVMTLLVEARKPENASNDYIEALRNKVIVMYKEIRQHEHPTPLSYFHQSDTVGNLVEKFLTKELKVENVPHQYQEKAFEQLTRHASQQLKS